MKFRATFLAPLGLLAVVEAACSKRSASISTTSTTTSAAPAYTPTNYLTAGSFEHSPLSTEWISGNNQGSSTAAVVADGDGIDEPAEGSKFLEFYPSYSPGSVAETWLQPLQPISNLPAGTYVQCSLNLIFPASGYAQIKVFVGGTLCITAGGPVSGTDIWTPYIGNVVKTTTSNPLVIVQIDAGPIGSFGIDGIAVNSVDPSTQ